MYYKNDNDELFFEPSQKVIIENKLQEITKEKFDEILANMNKPSFDEAKKNKQTAINNAFEAELNNLSNGLNIENIGVVDCGKQHLTNVQGLIKVVESGAIENVNFRLFDNSTTKLNLEQLKKIELAIILKGQELYVKKWELEAKINSAKNADELEFEITFN
ncbi:3-deoxy-D-arabino-heptulosonate 7-phosphate synthase [Campylobacter hyointestinalis subsp. hyointestinalis]|uniref:3-deoxy-D-arabino-heptulosonate 7-phosphate synthase n=1 Tax=Campylobacter hyointestinalis subsp. hyointestinalis TaxID=91352 RepID=A0A9W5EVN5_CAMHY|nr:DUF4376 domain-containing protein [Campylobacter hyointestinalis]CUU68212.1 3-deoxy-D-arabino-heptulosonate 7-phosphate synthase [Campylobacter hyointestinalis subsp. hyointestinalis]